MKTELEDNFISRFNGGTQNVSYIIVKSILCEFNLPVLQEKAEY